MQLKERPMAKTDSRSVKLAKLYLELADGAWPFVQCPACRGMGRTVCSKLQGQEGICGHCHGRGKICLIACVCGRPRRFDTEGLVVKGLYCCGSRICLEDMKPVIRTAKKITTERWGNDRTEHFNYGC